MQSMVELSMSFDEPGPGPVAVSMPRSRVEPAAGTLEDAAMAAGEVESEPLVCYQTVIRLEFTKPLAAMSPAELLQAARELRVLRFIRSMDTRNPVYQRILAMEQALASQYYLSGEFPRNGWEPGQPFDQNVLFASRQEFLALFDGLQVRVDSTPITVIPEQFDATIL